MNIQIQDFKKNIIEKYSEDISNIYMIQDYLILENLKECDQIISEIFNKEEDEKLISQNNGKFSILINNKFLLIAKMNELINIFKTIYNFLLSISKDLKSQKNFILSNIRELISLINLVLLFNDNITFYSLKKKILLLVINKDNNSGLENKKLNQIILSEYYFACTINKKYRKSAISWDYKYFLFCNFKKDIFSNENIDSKEFIILNLLKNELNIVGIKKDELYKYLFILKDLEMINEINIIQSRNFHLWTYLRKIYNKMSKPEKIIIILFSFYVLRKCSFDYSAFSFLVNSKSNIPLEKDKIKEIIKEMKKSSIIKYDDHKNYIDNLDNYIFN